MSKKELNHYIHQLNGKTFPEEVTKGLMNYLPESFDLLLGCVENSSTSERQKANALLILFDLVKVKCFSRKQEYFDLLSQTALHDSEVVRSVAAKLLAQLTNLADKLPEKSGLNIDNRLEIDSLLRKAIALGLSDTSKKYVSSFIGKCH